MTASWSLVREGQGQRPHFPRDWVTPLSVTVSPYCHRAVCVVVRRRKVGLRFSSLPLPIALSFSLSLSPYCDYSTTGSTPSYNTAITQNNAGVLHEIGFDYPRLLRWHLKTDDYCFVVRTVALKSISLLGSRLRGNVRTRFPPELSLHV